MDLPPEVIGKVSHHAALHEMPRNAGDEDEVGAVVYPNRNGSPGQGMGERRTALAMWLTNVLELNVNSLGYEVTGGLHITGPAKTVVRALRSDTVGSVSPPPLMSRYVAPYVETKTGWGRA